MKALLIVVTVFSVMMLQACVKPGAKKAPESMQPSMKQECMDKKMLCPMSKQCPAKNSPCCTSAPKSCAPMPMKDASCPMMNKPQAPQMDHPTNGDQDMGMMKPSSSDDALEDEPLTAPDAPKPMMMKDRGNQGK